MRLLNQKWMPLFVGILLASAPTVSAVVPTQTLTANKAIPKTVSASWSGGDVVSSGSNGSITLADTGSVTGIVKVRCNAATGYDVTFSTPNATGLASSNLIKGAGTTAQTKIPYLLTMDLSAFSATATLVAQTLKVNGSGVSVTATFGGAGNVTPVSAAQANQIKLNLALDTFDPADKEEGSYADTITTLVVIH